MARAEVSPSVDVAIEISAEAVVAIVRLLRLGVPVDEVLAALATALERQGEDRRAGRASVHVDSPPSGRPAGVVIEGIEGEATQRFLCRGRS